MKPKFTEKELDLIYKVMHSYHDKLGPSADRSDVESILEKLEK